LMVGGVALMAGSAAIMAGSAAALGDEGADGRFERRDSFHFTLHQDVDLDERGGLRGSRRFEQEVLGVLESAYDRLDDLLGLRPERKLVVYLWDPELFDQRYAGLFRFPAAGFYGGAIHVRAGRSVSSQLVAVLHHELVHAAFDSEAPRVRLPAWMNEGIAEWFEARALGRRDLSHGQRLALVRAGRAGALLPLSALSMPSLGGLEPQAAALAYLQSYGFVQHLVSEHGERKLEAFWSAVLRSGSLARGARRAYRSDLEELEADFRASLGAR
ncbi:MAG: peptidase MA family metallohydrolase, partial [bacterium]